MTIESVIENYMNGNITAAKEGAKRFSQMRLAEAALNAGRTKRKALAIGHFLKGEMDWQTVCNIEAEGK